MRLAEAEPAPGEVPRRGVAAVVERLVTGWALAAGVLLLAVVAMTVVSVLGAALFDAPFAGDFELVKMGVAVAAFGFLPYAQLTGADVTADIFTLKASPPTVAGLTLLAAVVALVCSLVLLWRMTIGMIGYRTFEETTAILAIPHWIAFVPILVSLALLALAAAVRLGEAWRATRRARGGTAGR